MSVTKLDLRKTLSPFYSPLAGEVELVKIPSMKFIMVDGEGAPATEKFQQKIGILYNLVYTMKFRSKRLLKKDYNVMALEGLWWIEGKRFDLAKREDWSWTLMIVVPDFVTDKMFSEAKDEIRRKKNPPGLAEARLELFDEGECVQIMHVGPYSTEPESIAKLEAFRKEHGFKMVGKHHEIYLGDPRRAAPSKLRTVIRHPVTGR
jgi:hypothetical protein